MFLNFNNMKQLIFVGLSLASVGLMFSSCTKEQIKQQNPSDLIMSNQIQFKSNGVVYANLTCELPNGENGCHALLRKLTMIVNYRRIAQHKHLYANIVLLWKKCLLNLKFKIE